MFAAVNHGRHPEIRETVFCLDCGYNLRGLTGDACPECGNSLAAIRLHVPRIPWLHRREKGRFRTYWQTVVFAMFRQRELCNEMARDVSYTDARRFRLLTVLHATAPLVVLALIAYLVVPPASTPGANDFLRGFQQDSSVTRWAYAAGWPIAVVIGAVALALAVATGVTSYFFRPRDLPVQLRNRAATLSHYASAPLAWTFVPLIPGLAGWAMFAVDEMVAAGLLLFAFMLLVVEVGVWWSDSVRLLRRTMPHHRAHAWLAAFTLPPLWAVIFAVILGAAGFIPVYVAIVVETLK